MNLWIESSYDFEDKKQKYEEVLIVAIDKGEEGTETIQSFNINQKTELEHLVNYINKEVN
jgi:hypothetical protein|tara:strand:+ start:412 stop:591 length:180 start_codon:yes stop_codon:yes gene_type:complete